MYERFTDEARMVLQLAIEEAQRLNHEYIATEHILLGLMKQGSGGVAKVLQRVNVTSDMVRQEIEKFIQRGPDIATIGKLPQTPRAKKCIENAMEECRNMKQNCVGTEHLLLGLLRDPDGFAAAVLHGLGITLEQAKTALAQELSRQNPAQRKPS